MTDISLNIQPEVENLRKSRRRSAVLKLEFLNLRSRLEKNIHIFVFEGQDDVIVYYHWVKKILPSFKYEPFTCGGKEGVKNLKSSLLNDKNDQIKQVLFFIDRDFDVEEEDDNITFITDAHSIENYLVNESVICDVLTNHFYCYTRPDLRENIKNKFFELYDEFLRCTRELNFRIFVARRAMISQINLEEKLKSIVELQLQSISSGQSAVDLLRLEREPSSDEISQLRPIFERLDPRMSYRGKFALAFTIKWLRLLSEDFNSNNSQLFGGLDRKGAVKDNFFGLEFLADKAPVQEKLFDFIERLNSPNC